MQSSSSNQKLSMRILLAQAFSQSNPICLCQKRTQNYYTLKYQAYVLESDHIQGLSLKNAFKTMETIHIIYYAP